MSAQVAADLRAAADVLERDGWGQTYYTDPDTGRHCAVGAIRVVLQLPGLASPTKALHERWSVLEEYLSDTCGEPRGATFWNDAPGRTADEVIAALRAAADRAEATDV